MYCKNCGEELIPGKRFCAGCGAPVEQVPQQMPQAPVQNQYIPVQNRSVPARQKKKGNKTKKILIPVAAVLVVIAIIVGISGLSKKKIGINDLSNPKYGTKVGNTYKFGSYEQDNDTANGKEEIEWIVLAKEDNKVLLISKYALDCKLYNETKNDGTWETCTLRKWLNDDFYNTAFNSSEQSRIQTTTVTADNNPKSDTNPGNDTQDKVFLLSYTEAKKYFINNNARKCAPTVYARQQGVYDADGYFKKTADGKAACCWWLRTPGNYSDYACYVSDYGNVYSNGYNVHGTYFGIRPALWINL